MKRKQPYKYYTQFSNEEEDEGDVDNLNEIKNPVDEEWELYKKCGWKTYGDDWSMCLEWWRTAMVTMPHLSRLVRWS